MTLKGCLLWNLRACMVRTMASAKKETEKAGGSREEQNSERDVEAFG